MLPAKKMATFRLVKTKAKLKPNQRSLTSKASGVIGRPHNFEEQKKIAKRLGIKVERPAFLKNLNFPFTNQGRVGGSPRDNRRHIKLNEKAIFKYFGRLRFGKIAIPPSYRFYDPEFLQKFYNLSGLEYGGWVEQEDRLNYTCGVGLILMDMNRILRFNRSTIGLAGTLGIAIGSRGVPNALAHFSPASWYINLSRYREDPALELLKQGLVTRRTPKIIRQITTSGVSSLVHEYGHALDFFFGTYIEKDAEHVPLSKNGTSKVVDNKVLKNKRQPLRAEMEKLFQILLWNGNKPSAFSQRISKESEYYNRRVEMWARVFETWVYQKLKDKGIENSLMHEKYKREVYPTAAEMKKLDPVISSITRKMRTILLELKKK